MRTRAKSEPVAYTEIGAYLHKQGSGKVSVRTYTSVNEPLKVDASEETKQIKKVRVEVHVKEDKSINGDKIYQKDVETIQISEDGESFNEQPTSASSEFPSPADTWDDFKRWSKNITDKLIDENKLQWVVIALSLLLGGLALGVVLALR